MIIKVELENLQSVLILLISALITINIVNISYGEPFWQINRLFGLGKESNFSTWFSSIMLAIAAFLAYQCSAFISAKNGEKKAWFLFSIILLTMSCDETAMIHEHLGNRINKYVFKLGHLSSAWSILLGPIILIALIGFILKLNNYLKDSYRAKILLLFGVIFFITGAIVLDAITNFFDYNPSKILWKIEILIEESFEMIGVLLIIMGLKEHFQHLTLSSERNNKITGSHA